LSLFAGGGQEHLGFAKHLTAEKRVEEFVAGRGLVSRWEAVNRNNHYLDALALACVAGHGIGQQVLSAAAALPTAAPQPPRRPERPDWMPESPTNWVTSYKGRW
jgi:hypothetical protein